MKLENPAGIVTHYGYVSDRPNMMPPLGSNQEATKTEPDKNTYLRLRGQHGDNVTHEIVPNPNTPRGEHWRARDEDD